MKFFKAFFCAAGLCGIAAPVAANCPGPGCPSGITSGIVGGMIGSAVAPVVRQKQSAAPSTKRNSTTKATTAQTTSKPGVRVERVSPAEVARAQNRAVQEALNRRGFNAGTVDGVVGRRTRAAIAAFQQSLGEAPTGTLTPEQERRLLGGS